jgi:glycosidase
VFLNKKEKQPEIRILLFFLKCTHTHDNINLFLRETRNFENRKPNYFYFLWRWIILFRFTFTNNKRVLFSASARVSNLCWCFYVHYFSEFVAPVIANFFIFSLEVREQIMQHLYGVQSSANTNTSVANIPTFWILFWR